MVNSPASRRGASTRLRLGSLYKFIIKMLGCDKYLLDKFSEEPDEWFLKLVVAFSRDIIVLKILLSVECNLLGLNFSVFHINFVANQHNRNILTNSDQILVPFRHILISYSTTHIKHDNSR